MTHACEAAIFAVQQLLPTDRVSVTIFDDEVQTLVPNTFAQNKSQIVGMIQGIRPDGSTNLHGGWKEGASQIGQNLLRGGLNRVVLLSDGLANAGETNADAIASDVNRLVKEGVSTTTLGVGDDYNEDLLESMARSGDGNYYYIESPRQLTDIFQTELQGLMATSGSAVSLGIEPQNGVTVADVLNNFDPLPTGRFKLPNLVAGSPILAVVRLNVPAMAHATEICRFRLAWNVPKVTKRQTETAGLTLPAVNAATWDALAANVEVQERAILLLIARYKKEATLCSERDDLEGARRWIEEAKRLLATAPASPEMDREREALAIVDEHLISGNSTTFRKSAKFQAHQRRTSKPYSA